LYNEQQYEIFVEQPLPVLHKTKGLIKTVSQQFINSFTIRIIGK